MLTLYIPRTYIHTHMYRVQLLKNINPKNENVVTGISEFIGTAKVPTSEVRTTQRRYYLVYKQQSRLTFTNPCIVIQL